MDTTSFIDDTEDDKHLGPKRHRMRFECLTRDPADRERLQRYAQALGYKTLSKLFYTRLIGPARRWEKLAKEKGFPGYASSD